MFMNGLGCSLQEQKNCFPVDLFHLHCLHCFKAINCKEKPKPNWSCDVQTCLNGCGHKFHSCKLSEHELLCSNKKVPCINAGYGCPFKLQRKNMVYHLPICPASIVVCTIEWNRWILTAKERERLTPAKGSSSLFNPIDLDLCFVFNDTKMVNEMKSYPKYVRELLCDPINKQFPCLPMGVRGTCQLEYQHKTLQSANASENQEEQTPLSGDDPEYSKEGVSPTLPDYNKLTTSASEYERKYPTCCHGISSDICRLCKDDSPEPIWEYKSVWREKENSGFPVSASDRWTKKFRRHEFSSRGKPKNMTPSEEELKQVIEDEKLMKYNPLDIKKNCEEFRTFPLPSLDTKDLFLELGLSHYTYHQPKPKSMFTFKCMEEVRRDEYSSHYHNVHSEIQQGVDGWILQRCPMHHFGCPFSFTRLSPGADNGKEKVIFCHSQRAFGITASQQNDCDQPISSCVEEPVLEHEVSEDNIMSHPSLHITTLPFEILERIASFLDGFSLNNLSVTCQLLRDVCFTQLKRKGLVLQEWHRYSENDKYKFRKGNTCWFFSKCFHPIRTWHFNDLSALSNHLAVCPYYDQKISSKEKFTYKEDLDDDHCVSLRRKLKHNNYLGLDGPS